MREKRGLPQASHAGYRNYMHLRVSSPAIERVQCVDAAGKQMVLSRSVRPMLGRFGLRYREIGRLGRDGRYDPRFATKLTNKLVQYQAQATMILAAVRFVHDGVE